MRLAPPPDGGPAGLRADEGPGEQEATAKRRISRRTVLQASLIGGAGVAALPLIALVGGITRTSQQPTDLAFSMNTNWLFGGQYTSGSESSFFDDSNFAPVTLPHTVTPLSWQNWDYLGLAAGVDLPAPLQRGAPARRAQSGQPDPRRLQRGHGQRVGGDQRPGGQHPSGRLPALLGRTHRARSPAATTCSRSSWTRAACRCRRSAWAAARPAIDFFQPGGIYRDVRLRVLPQVFLSDLFAQPADVLSSQPRVDVECTIDSAATTHATGTLLVELLDGTDADRGADHDGDGHLARGQHRQAEPDRSRTGQPVVARQPEAVHRPGHFELPRPRQPRPVPADRVPRGVLPARGLLPEREAAAAVRAQPAPALPVRRHGDARPGTAQGRRDPQERLQLQHGALLALSPVTGLPRRLRRTRPAGLGGSAGLAQRQHHPGLAGSRGAERPRHGDQGPEPSLGGHLGHQAQRDPGLPRAVGRDQAGRAGARQLAAEFGRDGLPRGRHLERGRLRLQRLRDRPEDRQHRAQAAVRRPALPGHRGGRRGSGQAAALRLDRPAGLAGQAGSPARPGAEPGTVQRRLRRAAGLGRVRLRLDARPGPGRHQVGRRGGRLPGPQARCRHLPDAGRPGRAPAHHPGVLLGGRRCGPAPRPRPR